MDSDAIRQIVVMPTRHIAYLRAVNVGKRQVPMARLRTVVAGLGLDDVATFIASGNVIFSTPRARKSATLETLLSREIEKAFGFSVDVFVRTAAENVAVAEYRPARVKPFPPDGDSLYVGFVHHAPAAASIEALRAYDTDIDRFHVHGREIYWHSRKTLGTSDFSPARLEKVLGAPATLRNITTVRKLAAMYPE